MNYLQFKIFSICIISRLTKRGFLSVSHKRTLAKFIKKFYNENTEEINKLR